MVIGILDEPISSLREGVTGLTEKASDIISNNPVGSAVVGAGVIGASGLLLAKSIQKRKRKKIKNARRRRRGRRQSVRRQRSNQRRRRVRGRHKHRTSPRGKLSYHTHRKTKGIHYTAKGQPYIILRSGKARFIKKTSAKRRKKLKGGYY